MSFEEVITSGWFRYGLFPLLSAGAGVLLASKNDHGATAAGRTEVRSELDGLGH